MDIEHHAPIAQLCSYRSIPDAENAIKVSRQYTDEPHMAGTDGDFKTAELFLSTLQEAFGILPPGQKPVYNAGTSESQEATRGIIERNVPSAWIDTYYPVMNTPLERTLQIVENNGAVLWDADLKEHAPEGDDKDQDAVKHADAVPTFHGLSVSGDVTGHLIDGNYCSKDVCVHNSPDMHRASDSKGRTTIGWLQMVLTSLFVAI
jgi:N-acetylated-alpha-linked acidic dipeptidase